MTFVKSLNLTGSTQSKTRPDLQGARPTSIAALTMTCTALATSLDAMGKQMLSDGTGLS